jgi:hypothetical protein
MYFQKIIFIVLTICMTISVPTSIASFPHTFTLLGNINI